MCILPIYNFFYTIHAVNVLTTFITKSTSKITALRIAGKIFTAGKKLSRHRYCQSVSVTVSVPLSVPVTGLFMCVCVTIRKFNYYSIARLGLYRGLAEARVVMAYSQFISQAQPADPGAQFFVKYFKVTRAHYLDSTASYSSWVG